VKGAAEEMTPAATPLARGGRAPLRLADWRFLLPQPPDGYFRHLVLLGASSGLAERLIELGLARRVSDSIPPERSADAVVALHGSRAALPEIAGCLTPGGVLYLEIDRRAAGYLASTPTRLRRALQRAGLSPTAMYAVVPEFSDHRMYLPLDVPGALRWYVTTLRSALTLWQQVIQAGLWAVTNLNSRRFAPLAPRLAVTAVAGRGPSAPASVLADPALPPALRRPGLRPLLLTAGGDRVVMLPFDLAGNEPEAVLKVPRLPGFNGRTQNDQAALRKLWSVLDSATRSGVPRPLGLLRYGEVTVAVESYARGQLLARSSERWATSRGEKLNDLRLAARWLTDFHLQTQIARSAWGPAERAEWLEGPCDAYRRAFGLTASEDGLFAKAREYAASLPDSPFPIVIQHRDFTVWNIARAGRELAILDWEGSRRGPALCDLLHFVTHWYETVHHAHTEAGRQGCFRSLMFEPDRRDPFRAAVRGEITRYMERLGIHRAFFPVLLLYTWIELALRRSEQQRVQGESPPVSREGNRNFAFVAILAGHADLLFAECHSGEQAQWP
jgi:aminoglycoside phosphotransferase (APT) family kinase protein